jgi:pyrimidine operon attenuation protein/uracil phosphoribosyltransferase
VQRRGVSLAKMLADAIRQVEGIDVPQGALDITFYRDDLSRLGPSPKVSSTEMPFDVTGQQVVLVDDVLYTGRTVRAALDAIIDYGRPAWIRLAVLADRGLRELPIQADFVGLRVSSARGESVKVELTEEGAPEDRIVLRRAKGAR